MILLFDRADRKNNHARALRQPSGAGPTLVLAETYIVRPAQQERLDARTNYFRSLDRASRRGTPPLLTREPNDGRVPSIHNSYHVSLSVYSYRCIHRTKFSQRAEPTMRTQSLDLAGASGW